ncbi:MAG: shikimate dehydrogenase, partial [Candidatus Dormibacteraeota bacterium]|nr:shikimate dehydrogenase [Candidatus Dormibacteraeota bacterium]
MRVLLIGHPVGHSLSPLMQNAAFDALALPHVFEARDTTAEGLAGALRALRDGRHLGANVTVPYKLALLPAIDDVDADVLTLGALNTIVATDGRLRGYNTDVAGAWEGLVQPVRRSLHRARVLVLGAGGGTRAMLLALSRLGTEGPAEVVVAARRGDAGEAAAELGRQLGLRSRVAPWTELGDLAGTAGVVVNCTPLGLADEDPLEGIPVGGT